MLNKQKVNVIIISAFLLLPLRADAFPPGIKSLGIQSKTLSNDEMMKLCLEIMEDNLSFAETQWHESNFNVPKTGYFGTGDGQKGVHSSSRASEMYATLLVELPDKKFYTKNKISRNVILNHCISALRWLCYTHISDEHSEYVATDGKKWGPKVTQFTLSWAAADMAIAGYLMRNILDVETKQLIEKVVTYEADVAMTRPLGLTSDVQSMQLIILAAAANFYPNHPNATKWSYRAQQVAIHAFTNLGLDKVDTTLVDGKPYKDWIEDSVAKSNYHPDYSYEHHAYFNPHYYKLIGDDCAYAAVTYKMVGQPIPEAFLKNHLRDAWEECLGPLSTWEGFWGAPQGRENFQARGDYNANHSFNAAVATMLGNPYAAAVQSRSLQFVRARQKVFGSGQLAESEDIDTFKWAWRSGFVLHKEWQTTNSKSYIDFAEKYKGVHYLPLYGIFIHRTPEKYIGFSWGAQANKNGLNGVVIPQSESYLDDPVLIDYPFHDQFADKNIIGTTKIEGKKQKAYFTSFNWEVEDDYFSTTGLIKETDVGDIKHYLSFTSFPNRVCIVMDELYAETTVTINSSIRAPLVFKDPAKCLYVGDRKIYCSEGYTNFISTSLPGNWWNISDRMGCVIDGGKGIKLYPFNAPKEVANGYWIASSYNSNFYVNPNQVFDDIATVYYPDTDHKTTQMLSGSLQRLDSQLPIGWSGIICSSPEGQRCMAITNFVSAISSASIKITYPEGAPVLEEDTVINNKNSIATITIPTLNSKGEILVFYINTDTENNEIVARQLTDTTVKISNLSENVIPINLKYFSRDFINMVIAKDENGNIISSSTVLSAQLKNTGVQVKLESNQTQFVNIINSREKDNRGPAVDIIAPKYGPVTEQYDPPSISGLQTVKVNVGDRSGVKQVEYFVDDKHANGLSVYVSTNAPNYEYQWDTSLLSSGYHYIVAKVEDNIGNVTVSTPLPFKVLSK